MDISVPLNLKKWFVLHFWVDMLFAIPLFFFPEQFLNILDWPSYDPITTRIVAAALFGIGIESLLGRNKDIDGYSGMLRLKIIWSFFASLGILLSLIGMSNAPLIGWLILLIFIVFHIVWIYWYQKIQTLNS